jgi:hypothetical protein
VLAQQLITSFQIQTIASKSFKLRINQS